MFTVFHLFITNYWHWLHWIFMCLYRLILLACVMRVHIIFCSLDWLCMLMCLVLSLHVFCPCPFISLQMICNCARLMKSYKDQSQQSLGGSRPIRWLESLRTKQHFTQHINNISETSATNLDAEHADTQNIFNIQSTVINLSYDSSQATVVVKCDSCK